MTGKSRQISRSAPLLVPESSGEAVPTDRLFFALFPDAPSIDAIVAIQQELVQAHGLLGRPTQPDRLHLTLQHLGDFVGLPSGVVSLAERAAAGLHASGFEIRLDQMGSFDSHRRQNPWVLTGSQESSDAGIHGFQRALTEALLREGVEVPQADGFTPHVTLLYDRHQLDAAAIDPVVWTAGEFVLIRSLLGQTRHIALGRWPLRS